MLLVSCFADPDQSLHLGAVEMGQLWSGYTVGMLMLIIANRNTEKEGAFMY